MMKRVLKIIFAVMLVAVIGAPFQAQASPQKSPDEGRRQYWRSGFILQSSPKYSQIAGKAASLAVKMQSAANTDVYLAFPAVSSKPYVRKASYYLLSRAGAYSGNVTLSLDVYNFDGVLQRTLSDGNVDLQAAPLQTWTIITLDKSIDNCQLQLGEFLAFHLELDGSTGGDLDIRPIFEVATEPIVLKFLKFYFPLATN
jgi:hypothetical protein